MTENAYFAVANTLSPLTNSLVISSLQTIDPVLFRLIQYFSGVLTLHMQDRWNAEVNNIGRSDLTNCVVNEVIPYTPLPLATDTQFRFPLLAAYRIHEDYEWKTISWYSVISEIEILYIMPPLTADQGESLYPFLTHAARTFVDRMAEGLDSNFNAGEQVWKEAGLDKIGMSSCDYCKVPGFKGNLNSNIWFPAVSAQVTCLERRMPVPINFEEYQGIDAKIKIKDDGYCPCDVALIRT